MQTFASITAAVAAARSYAPPSAIADRLAGLVDALSPVDIICRTGEALYANCDKLDDAGKSLCAGLISLASSYGWHGLGGERGLGIVQAMRRDLGETSPTGSWPDRTTDPTPDNAFVEVAAEAPIAPAPEAPPAGP